MHFLYFLFLVHLSNRYGDPTYSGVMTISESNDAKPGTYLTYIEATGDDPSINKVPLYIN